MGLRVTPSMLFRTSLSAIHRQRSALALTQERAATGRQLNRLSDDPAGAGAALLLRAGLGSIEQHLRNIGTASSRVAAAEQATANSFGLLVRARELAIAGANGTQDASSRIQIAQEIESLHKELMSEANARYGGGHMFSGLASDTVPFTSTGSFAVLPPSVPSVSFVADTTPIEIEIDERERVPVTFDGRRIFLGDADGDGTPDAGRENIFAVLEDLHAALVTNDGVAVAATISRLDASMDQLSQERTSIGAVDTRLGVAKSRLLDRQLSLESRISQVEDADLAKVVSDLVRQEAGLEAGLSGMARLLQPTLMDFLR